MSAEPFFSIIIPSYNRGAIIGKTINSVLSQDFSSFEMIIVDDGSTDDTEKIVNQFRSDKIRYLKIVNSERAAARNHGVRSAAGRYLNFLDSDDLLYPHHLSTAYSLIEKSNAPEVMHIRYDIKDEKGKLLKRAGKLKGNINIKLVKRGNFMSCIGVFLRKDIAMVHRFNEDRLLSGSEDHELWLRLAARYQIAYSNTITSTLTAHDERSVLNNDRERMETRLKVFIDHIFKDEKFVSVYGDYKRLMIAHTYTYIALHLSLTGKGKGVSLKFLLKAMYTNPVVFFSRRFFATLLKLVTVF